MQIAHKRTFTNVGDRPTPVIRLLVENLPKPVARAHDQWEAIRAVGRLPDDLVRAKQQRLRSCDFVPSPAFQASTYSGIGA